MKKLATLVCIVFLGAASIVAGSSRTLTERVGVDEIERVIIEAGVGDIEITAVESGTVDVEIELKPRRGGIFSSMRRAQREVDNARLDVDVSRREIRLRVRSDSDDRRFEERWIVAMPATLAIEIEHGVGDLEIRGFSAGVEIETGVGDVFVEIASGDVIVELGVGDVTINAPAEEYRSAQCSTGVGNARLRAEGHSVEGDGFIGDSASWRGDGRHDLDVDVGVGNARVNLD